MTRNSFLFWYITWLLGTIFPMWIAKIPGLIVCMVVAMVPCFAQLQSGPANLSPNFCGVKASFSPGHDSVVSGSFQVHFTSTSLHAISFSWFINGALASNNSDLQWANNIPGLYEFKLVASNGSCWDTAVCYYFYPGSYPGDRHNLRGYYGPPAIDDNATCLLSTSGGGYLMGGYVNSGSSYTTNADNGYLIKTDESGCIQWSRIIQSQGDGKIRTMTELQDQGFALLGYSDLSQYLLRLDARGNQLWAKNYSIQGMPFGFTRIRQSPDGGFVMAGPEYGLMGLTTGMVVLRTDGFGNIRWSRFYAKSSAMGTSYSPNDILLKGNDIYITGQVDQAEGTISHTIQQASGIILKINDATGQTLWTQKYEQQGVALYPTDLHWYGSRILMNAAGGNPGIENPNNIYSFLDTAGRMLQTYTLSTPSLKFYPGSQVIPQSNGDLYFLNAGFEILNQQPYIANHTLFIKIDSSGLVKWAKEYGHYSGGGIQYPALGPEGTFAGLGSELGTTIAFGSSNSYKFLFQKMDSTDRDLAGSTCNFSSIPVRVTPVTATPLTFSWTTDSVISIKHYDTLYVLRSAYPQVRYTCPREFIDSCAFMKLSGAASVCNLGQSYTYLVHRNYGCKEILQWSVSPGTIILEQSDTAITVKFPSFGNYTIAAILPYACSPVKDSVLVNASSSGGLLNLGPDTSLCPGQAITLHAGNRFLQYRWNDGSTDSTLRVNAAGLYWVSVVDSCNNVIADTVHIVTGHGVALNLASQQVICQGDSIRLAAPKGMIGYRWQPDYNIDNDTAQTVIIRPHRDTTYFLTVQGPAGCLSTDSIRVEVLATPSIYLGQDTSLCSGDSIMLHAGPGFSSYQWNNGLQSSDITVSRAGVYVVVATTTQGCRVADTLRVRSLFENPQVHLDQDSILCAGSERILDAGNFSSYLWNTGSFMQTLVVRDTGSYRVAVADQHHCTGYDSVHISSLRPPPARFLPADTAICIYSDLVITPLMTFEQYGWNDGQTTPAIRVSHPGTYWLDATDLNHCTGRDSIVISVRQCLSGFYAPDAFSPNADGRNDVFRPILLGRVESYEFNIYNRYGQLVFHSNQAGHGWDGNMGGKPAGAGAYVWKCTYQFQGDPTTTRQGTVLLLR